MTGEGDVGGSGGGIGGLTMNPPMHVGRSMWPRGLMDKASDFGSEDCRFESCRGRHKTFFSHSHFHKSTFLSR